VLKSVRYVSFLQQSVQLQIMLSIRSLCSLSIIVCTAVSASKVWWLELSQLSLCSEFDKENSIEFSLISLLLIHFTTVAMCLLSHGPHVTLVMWPTVTVTVIWPSVILHHTIVTLWQSYVILSRTPSCSCK